MSRPIHSTAYKYLKAIEDNQPCTRQELVDILGIPRTTIHDNVAKLIKKGLVRKYPYHEGKQGRPLIVYEVEKGGYLEAEEV